MADPIPTRASLRALLLAMLPGSKLDEFASDYFQDTYLRWFALGMPPASKCTYLLDNESPLDVLANLRIFAPVRFARRQVLLQFGASPGLHEKVQGYLQQQLKRLGPTQAGYLERPVVSFEASSPLTVAPPLRHRWLAWAEHLVPQTRLGADEILQERRILLLGDAGSGKSMFLNHAFLRARERHLKEPSHPLPLLFDLKLDVGDDQDLSSSLDTSSQGLYSLAQEEHTGPLALFIDNLDARLVRSTTSVNTLITLLERLNVQFRGRSVMVLLACRRAVWEEQPGANRDKLLSNHGFRPYSADHGSETLWTQILPDKRKQLAFWSRCLRYRIEPLLTSPYFSIPLARRFVQGDRLGKSRIDNLNLILDDDLKRAAVDDVLPREALPSQPRLLDMARALAFATLFTDMASCPLAIARKLIVTTCGDEFSEQEVRALLFSRLFTCAQGSYSFRHQIPHELLAAQVLSKLPLRSQLVLLCGGKPQGPLLPRYRSLALVLAQISQEFSRELQQREPMMALIYAEGLTQEEVEQLLHEAFEQGIAQYHTPWMPIASSGEPPMQAFDRFRPRDVGTFLLPYLRRRHPVADRWALTSLRIWGGHGRFTKRLLRRAADPTEEEFIRRESVAAVGAWLSSQKETSRPKAVLDSIQKLVGCDRDEVRGAALDVLVELKLVIPPSELCNLLSGGLRDKTMRGGLYWAVDSYPRALNKRQLWELFDRASERQEDLGKLYGELIHGWLVRATALGSGMLDLERFKQLLGVSSRESFDAFDDQLRSYLLMHRRDYAVLFRGCLDEVGRSDPRSIWYYAEQTLASAAQDDLFALLPVNVQSLTDEQVWFVRQILNSYFLKNPSAERLAFFQTRAPGFSQKLHLPQIPWQQASFDEVFASSQSSVQKVRSFIDRLRESKPPYQDEVTMLCSAAADLSRDARLKLKGLLHDFVLCAPMDETHCSVLDTTVLPYLCEQDAIPSGSLLVNLIKRRDTQWWAKRIGFLERVLDETSEPELKQESLRHLQRGCRPWIRAVLASRERNISQLVHYLEVTRHPRLKSILQQLASQVPSNDPQRNFLLFKRMQHGDGSAWEELAKLLQQGTAIVDCQPVVEEMLQSLMNGARLRRKWIGLLVDWYVLAQKKNGDRLRNLGTEILKLLRHIGGPSVCKELRRVRRKAAFPGRDWLASPLHELEQRQRSGKKETFPLETLAAYYALAAK